MLRDGPAEPEQRAVHGGLVARSARRWRRPWLLLDHSFESSEIPCEAADSGPLVHGATADGFTADYDCRRRERPIASMASRRRRTTAAAGRSTIRSSRGRRGANNQRRQAPVFIAADYQSRATRRATENLPRRDVHVNGAQLQNGVVGEAAHENETKTRCA